MSGAKRKFDTNYDPYKILGLEPGCSERDVDKAYKKQALKWHPDKNPDNLKEAEARFLEVYKAYEVLKDKEKKTELDGKAAAKKQRAAYDSQRKATNSAQRQHFLEKLEKKEKAYEERHTQSAKKMDASDERLLNKLRREGAQLLKRMAEENAAAETKARIAELERKQREQAEVAKVNAHPHAHMYNMSLDELNAFEDEVLGL